MSNLDLTIAKIMHGDTQILRIMQGDTRVWPSGTDVIVQGVLTNVVSSVNLPSSAALNGTFTTTLSGGTAQESSLGYVVTSVTVTMGGVDITSTAYNNGVITIADVTGDILIIASATEVIVFEDVNVKSICVTNWGGGTVAGEMTPAEAAVVTNLGSALYNNTTIKTFNELRYFTSLTSLYRQGSTSAIQGQFHTSTNGTSKLKSVTLPSGSTLKDLRGAFRRTKVEIIDLTPLTGSPLRLDCMAFQDTSVTKVILAGTAYQNMYYAFNGCQSLTTIEIDGTADFNSVSNFTDAFFQCSQLTTITGAMTNIKKAIDLSPCPLTRDSALVILNGLATISSSLTVKFKASTYNNLTADDIAIGTNKGWTVQSV